MIEGVTGVVVDGEDSAAIAVAAINLLNDPERAAQMGRAGRDWIVEKWRWQIWAEKFEQLLNHYGDVLEYIYNDKLCAVS